MPVSTLEVYFGCGGSLARTGERLHVHVNTVTQRLDRMAPAARLGLAVTRRRCLRSSWPSGRIDTAAQKRPSLFDIVRHRPTSYDVVRLTGDQPAVSFCMTVPPSGALSSLEVSWSYNRRIARAGGAAQAAPATAATETSDVVAAGRAV